MSKRVLVCEDDVDVRELVVMTLEESGYEVLQAGHGKQALALLDHPNHVGVLLLDMRMPVMDGWQTAAALHATIRHAQMPIVVITAAADAQQWAQEIGAQAFLAKPFSLDQMRATVRAILGPAC